MNDSASKDFEVRTEQFLGHYLKVKPAPLWMIQDMLFSERENIEKFLGLELNGKKP